MPRTRKNHPPSLKVVVFDVNETLLDVQTLAPHFQEMFGEETALREWFSLLLLHSEVATLAGPYFDFAALAGATLDMLAAARSKRLSDEDKDKVREGMLRLPPHPEVKDALKYLRDRGFRLVTLTNSNQKAVEQQVRNAGLTEFFERNFSIDTIRRYKPAPEPYQMVAREMQLSNTSELRLVAAHSWDIVGAIQAGCAGAFVARKGKALFPLVAPPDVTGPDLQVVAERIAERELS